MTYFIQPTINDLEIAKLDMVCILPDPSRACTLKINNGENKYEVISTR